MDHPTRRASGTRQATRPARVSPYHLTAASQQFLRDVGAQHRRHNAERAASRERVAQWGAR